MEITGGEIKRCPPRRGFAQIGESCAPRPSLGSFTPCSRDPTQRVTVQSQPLASENPGLASAGHDGCIPFFFSGAIGIIPIQFPTMRVEEPRVQRGHLSRPAANILEGQRMS